MHQGIFYQLYKKRTEDPQAYTPIWKLIGEVFVPELDAWAFVSYEVSARMSELYADNPQLFERRTTTGKSGSVYYEYRIALGAQNTDIVDSRLKSFYERIKCRR